MKPGDVGPLMAALRNYLDRVRVACETTDVCPRPTCSDISQAIDFPTRNVQRAIERLRLRRSQLAAFVRDGREMNRVRHRRPPSIVEAAKRSQSLLERAWRGSDLGELDALNCDRA